VAAEPAPAGSSRVRSSTSNWPTRTGSPVGSANSPPDAASAPTEELKASP
jgi:hypothetical protein